MKKINKLIETRGKGRIEYSVIPVWNSLLIMLIIEGSTIEQLRRELSRNRDLITMITILERKNVTKEKYFLKKLVNCYCFMYNFYIIG